MGGWGNWGIWPTVLYIPTLEHAHDCRGHKCSPAWCQYYFLVTLPLLPSSWPAFWPLSCGFWVSPFRLIHFCNATSKHPFLNEDLNQINTPQYFWISKTLVHPHTTGVWEDRRRACSGRIVAAQLQVWFGSLRPVPMEHTARHLELYYTLRDCWCNQLHVWYLSLIMIELKIQWNSNLNTNSHRAQLNRIIMHDSLAGFIYWPNDPTVHATNIYQQLTNISWLMSQNGNIFSSHRVEIQEAA